MSADATLEALQRTLAGEHAAVFVYGALGARTSRSAAPLAYARITDAYLVHQERRDALLAMIDAAGGTPEAPEPGYRLGDLGDAAAIDARARELEQAAAASYAFLVANSTERTRRWAIDALLDAGVRSLEFGGRPQTLPGL
ncbi:DUF4439 domain-containing protein [Nocardioides sp. YIM 152588]|uniref:DUF4439 domain-containing protein n=1 Tax=Nocardioides sp. YIM 152588 TaxID=3158259 RepID=UPI0032E44ECD